MDLTELYQLYQNGRRISLSNELYVNCTSPWFGSECQYSFPVNMDFYSIENIVYFMFNHKTSWEKRSTIDSQTCYVHLQCNCGEPSICLDWRAICNGRIDCIDGGADEAECSQLEFNICNEDELRCHTGVCIPKEFSYSADKTIEIMECLDTTNQSVYHPRAFDQCFTDPRMLYEEQMCRPGSKIFACSDGQCVQDYQECKNGRHLLLMKSVNNQGNLLYYRWIRLSCLSKINEKLCAELFQLESARSFATECDDHTQLPTIPVLYDHILFLYCKKNLGSFDRRFALPPDDVCYNEHLCDFLRPLSRHGISVYLSSDQLGLGSERNHSNWASMVNSL